MESKLYNALLVNTIMKTIHQKVKFHASPHEVYELLMDSKKHSEITESPANINKKVGGTFSAYDGWIEGEHIELIKDKKIVQKWRGADWPSGIYSEVTFLLKKVSDGCTMEFTQRGVPNEFYEDIKKGWEEYYWKKMKEYFKK